MEQKEILEILFRANNTIQDCWLLNYQIPVTEDTILSSLEYDSLEYIEFIMEVEKELPLEIEDAEAERLMHKSFLDISNELTVMLLK